MVDDLQYKAERIQSLNTLHLKPPNEPVSGVEAWALSASLTSDDETCRVWWPKMVGRPAERVRELSKQIRDAKPEQRQDTITRFGKQFPAKAKPCKRGDA